MKMEQSSETSAYKIQTPGNYPEESIQHNNLIVILLLLLALQPAVGFSLLSDFLPFCSFFALLSPPSSSHYSQIFNTCNPFLPWSPSSSRAYRFPLSYSLRCSLIIHPHHVTEQSYSSAFYKSYYICIPY